MTPEEFQRWAEFEIRRLSEDNAVLRRQLRDVWPQRIDADGGGSSEIEVYISSIVSGQIGRYNAKSFDGAINGAATGNLAEANLGTKSSTDNCIVWSATEIKIGSPVHLLDSGTPYTGRIAGQTSAGKIVVIVSVPAVGISSSPTALAGNGTFVRSTTWGRTTNGTPTISTYYRPDIDAANQIVRVFSWTETFDAIGARISVSAETLIQTNTGTICP